MNPPPANLLDFAARALGVRPSRWERMAGGGSDREFHRLWAGEASYVAALCADRAECRAFVGWTPHFRARGIPVPQLFGERLAEGLYLMEDLGPETLRDRLVALGESPDGRERRLAALETAVRWLPRIQVQGGEGLDYRLCPEEPIMGSATYRADIRLFLDRYVAAHAPASMPGASVRAALEALVDRAAALDTTHFCYRDFQTRNIMWREEAPVFLDYQSGRQGPLVYDLASILYSPDSRLDDAGRERLIGAYLEALGECGIRVERGEFLGAFFPMVLLRRFQALGAYARLAADKGKVHYLDKVPAALADLRSLLADGRIGGESPALRDWLGDVLAAEPRSAAPPNRGPERDSA